MPITCHFLDDAKLVVLVHVGAVPDDEFLASYRAFLEDPRLDTSTKLLVDLRRSDSSPRTAATLRRFAALVQRHYAARNDRSRAAVVAPQDLSFGLARLYEAYSDFDTMEVVVFRALDAALEWLGVPEDVMRQIPNDMPSAGPGDGSPQG